MHKLTGLAAIFFIMFLNLDSYAQTVPFNPYESIIFLEKDSQFKINLSDFKGSSLKLTEIGAKPAKLDEISLKIRIVRVSGENKSKAVFRSLYNKPRIDEKTLIREEWKKAFGMDVWYPYYKAKEIEHKVKEKLSIRVYKLKGTPEFSKNRIIYIFKTKF